MGKAERHYRATWKDVADADLTRFCTWYCKHFHRRKTAAAVFTTCMCGHFHTFPTAAAHLIERCKELGIIDVDGDTVNIITNNNINSKKS